MTNEQRIERLRPLWERWCREVAAANDLTYGEVCRRLEAGEAELQITATGIVGSIDLEGVGVP
jgi:hypothetical protein